LFYEIKTITLLLSFNFNLDMDLVDQFFFAAFTVDSVVFGFDEGDLKILLIKRGEEPFSEKWALPGHFVKKKETLDAAAERVLEELTGLKNVYLEQVRSFGKIDRHPAGRVITVGYFSLIKVESYKIQSGLTALAQRAEWHSFKELGDLAFDHNEVISYAFRMLKRRVRTQPIGFELLPPKFTLTELQHLYEAILLSDAPPESSKLDKRNFRKKILSMNLLVDLNEYQEGVAHRPAKLYRFDKEKYQQLENAGFSYEL